MFFSLWKAADSSGKSNLFYLSLLFLAHVGSRLPPLLLANNMSEVWMFTTTLIKKDDTFFVLVHSAQHDSDQQAKRAEWKGQRSQCSTAKISRHSGTNNIHNSRTMCLLPLVTILLLRVFKKKKSRTLHSFDRRMMKFMQVKMKKKRQTWSQCFAAVIWTICQEKSNLRYFVIKCFWWWKLD